MLRAVTADWSGEVLDLVVDFCHLRYLAAMRINASGLLLPLRRRLGAGSLSPARCISPIGE